MKKASASEQTVFVYDAGGKMIAEYSSALAPVQQVSYLTTDHLGSPRITTNQLGVVTNRKDFMAFGDEAISAQRVSGTNGNKYEPSSPTRKDYTGYEKDMESGLEFAQARYYSPTHGRFTSVDPLTASANVKDPQTLNRYSYVLNSPYKFTDPLGLLSVNSIACGACGNEHLYVDGSAFRGTDATLKTQNQIWREFIAQVQAALGIAEGGSGQARPVQTGQAREILAAASSLASTAESSLPPLTSGISVIIWANRMWSTRVLGHASYIIDEVSYSFDNQGYNQDPKPLNYIASSSESSAGVMYNLDFDSRQLNTEFKNLLIHSYDGANGTYTGPNNCSSGFVRAINGIANRLRNVKPYTGGSGTPAGIQTYITTSLKKYITATVYIPQTKP